MTPKRPKSVLEVGNPTPMPLKTPILGPFWKLVWVRFEDIMGEKGHFQSHWSSFCQFNERCVRQNDLKLLASVAFPSPRPTCKGNPARTLRGFLFGLVFPVGYRPTCQPESSTGYRVPDSECYVIGFPTQKENHCIIGFPTVVDDPTAIGFPTPSASPITILHCTFGFPIVVDDLTAIGFPAPSASLFTIGFPTSNRVYPGVCDNI